MAVLYERIEELCTQKGVTGYRMCKDVGISPGVITDLKMGRRVGLSAKSADKIASYFGVSVGYLLGTEEKAPTPVSESGQPVNVVKIAGRDGSYVEKYLNDKELQALKAFVDLLPDADDGL